MCAKRHFWRVYTGHRVPSCWTLETSILGHKVFMRVRLLWGLYHCHLYSSSLQMRIPHGEVCVHRTSTFNRLPRSPRHGTLGEGTIQKPAQQHCKHHLLFRSHLFLMWYSVSVGFLQSAPIWEHPLGVAGGRVRRRREARWKQIKERYLLYASRTQPHFPGKKPKPKR